MSIWGRIPRSFTDVQDDIRFIARVILSVAKNLFLAIKHPQRTAGNIFGFVKANWPRLVKASAAAVLAVSGSIFLFHYVTRFNVAPDALSLLPKTSVETKLIQSKDGAVSYSASGDNSVRNKLVLADPSDATNGTNLYEASLGLDPGKGLTFSQTTPGASQSAPSVPGLPAGAGQSDAGGKLSFSLTPIGGGVQQGKITDSHVQYPSSGGQRFYTFRKNGVAEDIILSKAPGSDSLTYQWKLDLPSSLEARMMGDGSVGIYSANPELFGNVQVGDSKSQALLDKARKNGAKDTLAFVLPAPFIKNVNGKTDYRHTRFSLDKNILTLTATGLKKLTYPLSIDPSVVVTTTGDFQLGYDDGMIDYGNLNANAITRNNISAGTVGAWSSTNAAAFATARRAHTSVAYNGYVYVIGGTNGTDQNDIQFAKFNTDGSLVNSIGAGGCPGGGSPTSGTWCATTSFPTARDLHGSVAYNGYLYIVGGQGAPGYLSDIQFAKFNTDGSLVNSIGAGGCPGGGSPTSGTWCATTSLANPRANFGTVAYNGYLYIIGGGNGGSVAGCNAGGFCNDIEYCPINADGSLGSCTQQLNAFDSSNPRDAFSTVVYNGYLYIIGGSNANGSFVNYIQYCSINSNGSVGTCNYTCNGVNNGASTTCAAFPTARFGSTSIIANGYLYIIGGGTSGTTNVNDVQYCPINPNGTVGTCNTSSTFTTARHYHTSVEYNGYIYIIGGQTNASATGCTSGASTTWFCNDVQYAQIQPMGTAGSSTQQTSAFTAARYGHTSFVYNDYLYIVGGYIGTASTACNATSSSYCTDVIHCPINTDGSVGTCVQQKGILTSARAYHGSAIANGYLYVTGGYNGSLLQDVLHCALNSDGTVGTCVQQATAFTGARNNLTSVTYNGYLYIVGGTITGNNAQNDIQYAWLDPSSGAACLPSNHATCTGTVFTQQAGAFGVPRSDHNTVVYNGYLYIIAGSQNSSNTNCNTSSSVLCSSIQFCPLNSNGSVGTCDFTHSNTDDGTSFGGDAFPTGRYSPSSSIYNGYLFISGGCSAGGCSGFQNDVIYCPLNTNGTVGACAQQTGAFTTARQRHTTIMANGFMYVIGGCTAGDCTAFQNDIQRLWVGQMGQGGSQTQQTSAFTTGRYRHGSVAYNGYLYIAGGFGTASAAGCDANGYCNDVQYAAIQPDGSLACPAAATCPSGTVFAQVLNAFTGPRDALVSVAYDGYLYIIGGEVGTSTTGCTTSGGTGTFICKDIQYCPLNSTTGAVGTCQQVAAALAGPRMWLAAAVYNGYIYTVGGGTDPFGSDAVNEVEYCALNTSTGAPSTCTQQSGILAGSREFEGAAIYNGYLYVAGGNTGVASSTGCDSSTNCSDIMYCPINPSTHAISSCNEELAALPAPYSQYGSILVADGYLYIATGLGGGNTLTYCPITSTGWVGACLINLNAFTGNRYSAGTAIYGGNIYVEGGGSGLSDVDRVPISASPQLADYERTLDTGTSSGVLQSIVVNGTMQCGFQLWYATAGSNGQFGSFTVINPAYAGATNTLNISNQRYVLVKVVMDDQTCGGTSKITDITLNYANPPSTPTITTLSANATDITTLTPAFSFKSSQALNDNLQYRVKVCTDSGLTTACQTATQVTGDGGYSQTGWSGQDRPLACSGGSCIAYRGDTTLANSTLATYTYTGSPALNWGTTYYWQATACDATDTSNGCTSTAVQNFLTSFAPTQPTLMQPSASQASVSTMPQFHFYSTDQDSDYLQYWVDICGTSNCSSVVQSVCQVNTGNGVPGTCSSPSQTGWSSQNLQSGTAYSAGQTAILNLQTALTAGTQYWWRVYAIDPGGTNTWVGGSSIQTFTTTSNSAPKTVHIGGNVNIGGGNVTIKP